MVHVPSVRASGVLQPFFSFLSRDNTLPLTVSHIHSILGGVRETKAWFTFHSFLSQSRVQRLERPPEAHPDPGQAVQGR